MASSFTDACRYWNNRDVNKCFDELFVKDNPDEQIKLDKLQDELSSQRILLEKQSKKIEELHKMIQDLIEKHNKNKDEKKFELRRNQVSFDTIERILSGIKT